MSVTVEHDGVEMTLSLHTTINRIYEVFQISREYEIGLSGMSRDRQMVWDTAPSEEPLSSRYRAGDTIYIVQTSTDTDRHRFVIVQYTDKDSTHMLIESTVRELFKTFSFKNPKVISIFFGKNLVIETEICDKTLAECGLVGNESYLLKFGAGYSTVANYPLVPNPRNSATLECGGIKKTWPLAATINHVYHEFKISRQYEISLSAPRTRENWCTGPCEEPLSSRFSAGDTILIVQTAIWVDKHRSVIIQHSDTEFTLLPVESTIRDLFKKFDYKNPRIISIFFGKYLVIETENCDKTLAKCGLMGNERYVLKFGARNSTVSQDAKDDPLASDPSFQEVVEAMAVCKSMKTISDQFDEILRKETTSPEVATMLRDMKYLAARSKANADQVTIALFRVFMQMYHNMLNEAFQSYQFLSQMVDAHKNNSTSESAMLFESAQKKCIRVDAVVGHIIDAKFDVSEFKCHREKCPGTADDFHVGNLEKQPWGLTNDVPDSSQSWQSHLAFVWKKAKAKHGAFREFIKNIADKSASHSYIVNLKAEKRCQSKVEKEYLPKTTQKDKPWKAPASMYIRDILRATIVCKKIRNIRQGIQALETLTTSTRKDRLQVSKLHDVLVNFMFDGLACEVQFHLEEFYDLKHFVHGPYEVTRAKDYRELINEGRLTVERFQFQHTPHR